MVFHWLKRILMCLIFAVASVVLLVANFTNPNALSREEISEFTTGLNEAAAIGVPHGFLMPNETRALHLGLLAKVEAGAELTAIESTAYRTVFQQALQGNQRFLAAFDTQLSVLPEVAMETANNCQSFGIAGQHDHHDVSARANFSALLASLEKLELAENPLVRIASANSAQKDLVDLISHLGVMPHTVSVPYVGPEAPWRDVQLGAHFEAMLKAFKTAQFQPVHSLAYWAAIDVALGDYNELIMAVQSQVIAATNPWERRISGRFLSMQTMAPPVDLTGPLRRK